MSKVLVTESNLQDIADAIRSKNEGTDTYRPGDMAAAILAIPTGGGSTLVSKTITQNGEYDPEDDNADGYSDVTVNVPNSYSAEDEGKVVSSGALVAQTGLSVTENGTYDTTENDEVVVNVQGGGGEDPFALTDYIESSGTQWIDTGYLVKQNSRFELVANINGNNNIFACMFGTRINSNPTTNCEGAYLWCRLNGSAKITADFGTGQTDISSIFGNAANIYNIKTNLVLQNRYVGGEIDGTQGALGILLNSSVTPTNQYPLYLFNLDEAGSEYGNATRCIMKLYRFRIYENDILVHEFIPWNDDNDTVCLKDTVTGNIKYNIGTGVFTRGIDV